MEEFEREMGTLEANAMGSAGFRESVRQLYRSFVAGRTMEILTSAYATMRDIGDPKAWRDVAEAWRRDQILSLWSPYVAFVVESHSKTLTRKRRNLCVRGDYGEVNVGPWFKELRYFLTELCGVDDFVMEEIGDRLCGYLDANISDAAVVDQSDVDAQRGISPTEYERRCADRMRACGFEATVTKASGDQGVDVIARKPGLVVALQCKLHSFPVGNKAVQEVHAGKQFVGADLAAVVSNNEFTDSARQLAQALGVLLLHDSDIQTIFGR